MWGCFVCLLLLLLWLLFALVVVVVVVLLLLLTTDTQKWHQTYPRSIKAPTTPLGHAVVLTTACILDLLSKKDNVHALCVCVFN